MSLIRVKGFKIFVDRHGKPRCYHRATNHKIDIEKAPLGSAEFFAECARIAALTEALKSKELKPGTLGGLFVAYFKEEHFDGLSKAMKREYRMCAGILEPIKETPVGSINTPLLAAIHDKLSKKYSWDKANRVRNFQIQVFKFCIPKGLITENFAEAVIKKPRPKDAPTVNRAWSYDEVQTVLAASSQHLRAALAMIYCTGLDPSDALGLMRDQMDDGVIWKARDKTQEGAAVPVNSVLYSELKRAPDHNAITILASSKGTPWTYDGFSSGFHRLKRKLHKTDAIGPGLTAKGLRHTMATWLREAGQDERNISDLLAQKSKVMGLHYSKDASLARKNKLTMAVWEEESERRSKVVKPFIKAVKP